MRLKWLVRAAAAGIVSGTVLGGAACVGPLKRSESRELIVSAAISLSDVLAAVVTEYERTSEVSVIVNAAGSDTLATQLIAGARADVFLSADTRQMDRLESHGLVAEDSRVDLFTNQLVAVVRSDAGLMVTGVDDLLDPAIRRIALGDPASVPAGVYAREYLQEQDLWMALRDKVVPTRNVRAVLAAVEAGHAEVGIVYRTDLSAVRDVVMAFAVPPEASPPIRYPGAVLLEARHSQEAHRFLGFLRGRVAQSLFEEAGFGVIGAGGDRDH